MHAAAIILGELKMKDLFIKDQQRKLIEGQINRRQFMVSVLATGIAASTALSLASQAEAATRKRWNISLRRWTRFDN